MLTAGTRGEPLPRPAHRVAEREAAPRTASRAGRTRYLELLDARFDAAEGARIDTAPAPGRERGETGAAARQGAATPSMRSMRTTILPAVWFFNSTHCPGSTRVTAPPIAWPFT